jgi:hypothetical protein
VRPYLKKNHYKKKKKKKAGGVAQGLDPEFKPQYGKNNPLPHINQHYKTLENKFNET